jgi:quinol monooxygenase YgiN
MIQVCLSLLAKPNDTAARIETLQSLMLRVEAEPGLLACRLYVRADNPDAICYVEEWQTPDELNQQIRSSHYAQLISVMEEAAEPPDFRVSWVSDVKGLEYLSAVKETER